MELYLTLPASDTSSFQVSVRRTVSFTLVRMKTPVQIKKRGILSLKKQHRDEDEENDDPVLNSSMITKSNADEGSQTKSLCANSIDSASQSETEIDTDSDEASEKQNCAEGMTQPRSPNVSDPASQHCDAIPDPSSDVVPGPSAVSSTSYPIPGPSSMYEDISFEASRTSTPTPDKEMDDQDDKTGQEENDGEYHLWDVPGFMDIVREVQTGREQVVSQKKDFLKDVKTILHSQSKLYVPKLKDHRGKLVKRANELRRFKKEIDTLISGIKYEIKYVDSEIRDYNHFIKEFPEYDSIVL